MIKMVVKPCSYCGENTAGKSFYSGKGMLCLPGRYEKCVYIRVCAACTKEYRLTKYGLKRGGAKKVCISKLEANKDENTNV